MAAISYDSLGRVGSLTWGHNNFEKEVDEIHRANAQAMQNSQRTLRKKSF